MTFERTSNLNFHVLWCTTCKVKLQQHTFKFAIIKTWEEIPAKIKTLSCHKFKKEYKKILTSYV